MKTFSSYRKANRGQTPHVKDSSGLPFQNNKPLDNGYVQEEEDNGAGYHVMGRYTSVSWHKKKEDADALAKKLNMMGGTHHTVQPGRDMSQGRPTIKKEDLNEETSWAHGHTLHPDDQKHVLNAYVHRYTGDHTPNWVKNDARYQGHPHFHNDKDWLQNTKFKVKKNGRLHAGARHCESNPTWPNGQPKMTEATINEKLGPNSSASDYIDDFVHSKNRIFKGDSKLKRIRRALGAYYKNHR